jgi:hypothetical protein
MRQPRFLLKAVANEIMAALKDANLIAQRHRTRITD